MTKPGRKHGWRKPAHAAVEQIARQMRSQCSSDREAVRRAADIYSDFGDVVFGDGHPASGLGPTPAQENRELSAEQPRQKARMAKWEARLKAHDVGPDEPPPWPETRLDSRDTVVDQIARRLASKK